MDTEKVSVYFTQGYGASVKAVVSIGDETIGRTDDEIKEWGLSQGRKYVLDLDWLSARLEKEIQEKGYTVSKSNRQKHERLIIND